MTLSATPKLDVLIVGGGAAGLWLLNSLDRQGYACALLEADTLGSVQTLASQGIIHSGLKYGAGDRRQALRDRLRNMPARWRACLAADPERPAQDPDLAPLEPVEEGYYLFSSDRHLDRLRTFVASQLLAADSTAVEQTAWPAGLRQLNYQGQVIALDEFTLDVAALLERLAEPVRERILKHRFDARCAALVDDGISIEAGGRAISARQLLLCAGAGNGPLLEQLGITGIGQTERPLHQVVVRDRRLPQLNGHCLTGSGGSEPRLTITSHRAEHGGWDWYLGGQLATGGCRRSTTEQIAFARRELAACVPQLDWTEAAIGTLRIDRAEPDDATQQRYGTRGRACAIQQGPVTVCWPIKLTLLPDLADQVLATLPPASGSSLNRTTDFGATAGRPPAIAGLPWQTQ